MSAWREKLLQRLSRQTSSVRFIAEIDGLRFIAIWSVVLFHTYAFVVGKLRLPPRDGWLANLMSRGAIGVELFFVISGLIISLPFAQAQLDGGARPSLSGYYRRRLSRLEPPYILNLLAISALMLVLHKLSPAQVGTHLLSSLTYTHNLVHGEASLINGVAWSLEVECQFYLVAPLLANIFRFRPAPTRRLLLVVAIALSACASEYLIPQTPRWRLSLPSHLSFFFCGFLLADLFAAELLSGPRRHASRTYSWDAVGVLAWLTLLALLVGPASLRILLPLPILLAYCAAFRGRSSGKFFANRYIFTIGGMCYTIYLYHEFIISFFGGVFVRLPGLKTLPTWTSLSLASLVLAPIVLVICSVLFALTEKPFMYSNWPALVRARWAGRSHERQVRAPRGSGAP